MLVLAGTVVLSYMAGKELHDTAFAFILIGCFALITFSAFCSFIAFIVLTVKGLYKHEPRPTIRWHALCAILALLMPLCVSGIGKRIIRFSEHALFEKVGVETIRSDAAKLIQNFEPPKESRSRMGHSQRITRDKLPDSFRRLGLGEVNVFKTAVFAEVGGFGNVRSGYTLFPTGDNSSPTNAIKIVNGIYYSVTKD